MIVGLEALRVFYFSLITNFFRHKSKWLLGILIMSVVDEFSVTRDSFEISVENVSRLCALRRRYKITSTTELST